MTFKHITRTDSDDKSPDFNLLLMIDQGKGENSRWIELTGLWRTRDG